MSAAKRKSPAKKRSDPQSPAARRSWARWILPSLGLVALVVLGLEIREKLQTDVWAFYTDEEGLKVDVQQKKVRMVLWEDPQ